MEVVMLSEMPEMGEEEIEAMGAGDPDGDVDAD